MRTRATAERDPLVSRVLAVGGSPLLRAGFLVLAVALAVAAVVLERDAVSAAISRLDGARVAGAMLFSLANVLLAMMSWRAVMADLGSPLHVRDAARIYLVGQVGKYVPGGVWNLLAAAELGRDHGIPRRRTVAAMLVTVLLGVTMGVLLALVLLPFAPGTLFSRFWWASAVAPLLLVVIHPAVLNRLLAVVLRLTRRDPLDGATSIRGTAVAAVWAIVSWFAVGIQVWLLATALGAPADVPTLALTTGGYALAWVLGFLVLVVPAGVGPREAALALVLAGLLGRGEILVVVLLSRVLLTVADLGTAGVALLTARRRVPNPPR